MHRQILGQELQLQSHSVARFSTEISVDLQSFLQICGAVSVDHQPAVTVVWVDEQLIALVCLLSLQILYSLIPPVSL